MTKAPVPVPTSSSRRPAACPPRVIAPPEPGVGVVDVGTVGQEEVRAALDGVAVPAGVDHHRAPRAAVVECFGEGVDVEIGAAAPDVEDLVAQRDGPAVAEQRLPQRLSSCSDARSDGAFAACSASLAGMLLLGHADGSPCQMVHSSFSAGAPTTGISVSRNRFGMAKPLTSSSG